MIFFDLGWTLEDETPAQRARARATVSWAADRGLTTTVDQILQLQAEAGGRGAPSVYPEALARLGLTSEDHQIIRRSFPWKVDLCSLVPGAFEGLKALAPTRLGLVANQSRPMAPRLDRYGIGWLFAVRICSCEVGLEKPGLEIFRLAEREAQALGDPGPHWMVGDRVDNDIVPAKSLGWRTLRIKTGDYRLYQSRGPEETPDFEVETLAEAFIVLKDR